MANGYGKILEMVPLSDLRPGQSGEVVEIKAATSGRLLSLSSLGLAPGSLIRLQQRVPAFIVWVGETQLSLDREVAQDILLRRV
jgi:DtxR family Mn-dependent transcriptional regulator